MYVLDSIAKNVGTPYTLYFGRSLYNVFMGAYAKVDGATRRKMDEMLRTWKEPIPGAFDKKPVFPPDVVRPIENALIGARNAALAANQGSFQGQQQFLRTGRPSGPIRDTPTPPNVKPAPSLNTPLSYGQHSYPIPNGAQQADALVMQQSYPIHVNNVSTIRPSLSFSLRCVLGFSCFLIGMDRSQTSSPSTRCSLRSRPAAPLTASNSRERGKSMTIHSMA